MSWSSTAWCLYASPLRQHFMHQASSSAINFLETKVTLQKLPSDQVGGHASLPLYKMRKPVVVQEKRLHRTEHELMCCATILG